VYLNDFANTACVNLAFVPQDYNKRIQMQLTATASQRSDATNRHDYDWT